MISPTARIQTRRIKGPLGAVVDTGGIHVSNLDSRAEIGLNALVSWKHNTILARY